VSNDADGDRNDNLPLELERIYESSDHKFVAEMERRKLASDGPQVWVFTADTVNRAASASLDLPGSGVERLLPSWAVPWTLLRTPVWRWAAFLLALFFAGTISGRVSSGVLRLLRPVCKRFDPSGVCDIEGKFLGPTQMLVALAAFRIFIAWIPVTAVGRFYL